MPQVPEKKVRLRGSTAKAPSALKAAAQTRKAEPAAFEAQEQPEVPVVEENWFRLGYLIHDVSRMRRTLYDVTFKPEGITRSQWWALSNICRDGGEGISSTELARLMDVGKVTVGGLVDRLEEAGYVYRRADKSDLRAKKIFVTEAGKRLMGRMRTIAEGLNKRITEGMTRQDVAAAERHMIHIKNNLRRLLAEEKAGGEEEDEAEAE